MIARHPRSYEREGFVFDPLHYLALLERKICTLDQAAPLVGWALPEEFATLRRLIEARMATRGKRPFEAGRDGFWLARWLRARGVEAHVIHPSSVAVSREHRRAKTDRLDTELLEAGVLGVAAWRTRPLHHGAHPDDLPKRTPSGPIASASAWSGNARASSTE